MKIDINCWESTRCPPRAYKLGLGSRGHSAGILSGGRCSAPTFAHLADAPYLHCIDMPTGRKYMSCYGVASHQIHFSLLTRLFSESRTSFDDIMIIVHVRQRRHASLCPFLRLYVFPDFWDSGMILLASSSDFQSTLIEP
jgi:hypothetical protein